MHTMGTFVGPCFIIYFYSKTNQMHNISNLFYFGTTLYMFLTVFPSIIRSLRLYIQHQVYDIQVLWPLASKQPQPIYITYTVTLLSVVVLSKYITHNYLLPVSFLKTLVANCL